MTIKEIISVYRNHPSIPKIKNLCVPEHKFDLAYASTSNINKIIKSLNENKATGPEGISAKFLKMSAVIDFHLANRSNKDIPLKKYSKHAKTVTARPIFKKDGRTNIKNYRPVSLLNNFSKIYERFLHENLTYYVYTFLSKYISAYRKFCSSNHLLIRLTENWKKSLDQKKFVATVLMDLSKALDSITHDLDSKNACLWFVKRCCYILSFVFKKT